MSRREGADNSEDACCSQSRLRGQPDAGGVGKPDACSCNRLQGNEIHPVRRCRCKVQWVGRAEAAADPGRRGGRGDLATGPAAADGGAMRAGPSAGRGELPGGRGGQEGQPRDRRTKKQQEATKVASCRGKGPDGGVNVRPANWHPARGGPAGRPHPFPGEIGAGIAPGVDRGDWPNPTNRPGESQAKEKADRIASVLPARKKLATVER